MAMDRRITLALRYCVMAWLAVLRWVLLLGMLVCFGVAVWAHSPKWLIAGGIVGGCFLLVLFVFMIESAGVKCLMCGAGMLRKLRCSQHKDAKRWLGSAVLRSTFVLATFPKSMDCPYCGGHYKLSRGRSRSGRRAKKQVSSL